MPRNYSVYLQDMLEAARKVHSYTEGLTKEAFATDDRTVDAVVRNLEVLGEAAKGIPDEFRQSHPAIPWKRISGLRDVLIHEYFGIDLDIVWDIVQNKTPPLERELRKLLIP
ncbi:MAG: DUF86 domain-containing protein [Phycisphaerae bacterium]